jgi:hypothetical protein
VAGSPVGVIDQPGFFLPMSYKEISEILGVSTQRVRQIEKRALEKLRKALVRQGITADDVKATPSPGQTFNFPEFPDRAH